MKSTLLSLGIIFITLLSLNSCGLGEAKDKSIKEAEIFHGHMKKQQTKAMVNMIGKEGLKLTPKEEWAELFESIHAVGKIKKITKDFSFNSNISNGVTTVDLSYTVEFEDQTFQEKIFFQNEGDNMKIIGYSIQ